ncbi:MAG TPA: hypothetical protein EYG86_02930 [Crocinitomicaceae bacterium]|nr:hypothetical protein [Crocinitomicaceae bacterium]
MKLLLAFIGMFLIVLNANALTDQEKQKIIETIYQKIYNASSDKGIAPSLKFDTYKARQIAYMMKDRDGKPMIGFESKAFEVCEKFGNRRDDAIALLLGHEISHHIMRHHWGKEFRSAYSIGELEKEIKDLDKGNALKFETQADENGGILCFMAGYDTGGLAEELLKELYKAYNIQDSPKYPSLAERIKIAKTQDSLVQTYIKVFETANYALMIQEYDIAIRCFDWVTTKFQSREIYNNYGVALFLKGIEESDPDDIKYIYPIELDLESKINARGLKGMGDDVKALFEKSIEMFEKAVDRDKKFLTGKLNIACAYSVLSNFRKAKNYAEDVIYDADKTKDKYTILNAKLVLAIINDIDENGDKGKSKQILDDLISQGHLLAEMNQQLMEGEDISEIEILAMPLKWMDGSMPKLEQPKYPKRESLTGLSKYSMSALQNEIPNGAEEQLKFGRDDQILIANFDDSRLYFIPGDKFILFHATKNNYTGTTEQGIKLGSTKDEVLSKYGAPGSVNTTKQGLILSYPKNKLLVLIGHENTVTRWIVWRGDL